MIEECNFNKFIKKNGFKQDPENNLRWLATGEYRREYILYYEGYAYVLYMIYRELEVPLAHFQNAVKLQTFYNILNTKFPHQ